MAVNQVSLFFYTPRWQQLLTPDQMAITDEGKPVNLVHSVPVVGSDAQPVSKAEVMEWLVERGFEPVEWNHGQSLQRGEVRSMFGPEKEIEIWVGGDDEEVTKLYCRFTLPRRTPPSLSEWAMFAAELCHRFHLRLGDEGVAPCGEAEFLAAVRGNRNYQEFAAGFGWETV